MSVYESTAPRGGGLTMATALVALVTVAGLLTRPLLAIDETRYAAVALEMLHRGDWLVPYLNGQPYSHKPPLLFWLILAGWKVAGVSTVWARLVGPLVGVGALALVGALARALWPRDARTRGWAPLVTAGAVLWGVFSSLLMFDTLLAGAALLALLGVVQAAEHGRRRGIAMLAAGITLGILAKGPVIFVHVLPVALLAPWWTTPRAGRRWGIWYLSLAGALLLGAGAALLWAVPAGRAGGEEYQRAIFLGQTTGRIASSFAHGRPLWWYLPLLPLLCFPWFAWPEAWRALRGLRTAPRDAGVRFAVTWALTGVVAFSLLSGKQVHYLLPLIPAGALLLSRGLSLREAAPLARPWLVAIVIAIVASAVLVLAANARLAARLLWWPHGDVAWWWALVPLSAAVMLVAWQRGHATRNTAVHALAASTAVLLAALQLAAATPAAVPYDTAPMAAAVRRAVRAGHPIAMLGTYNGEYHFEGRLQDVHIDVVSVAAVGAWLGTHRDGLLLRYDRGRVVLPLDGLVASHPFRNGWATLSRNRPAAGRSAMAVPSGE